MPANSNYEYDQTVNLRVRNEILNTVKDTDIKDTAAYPFRQGNTNQIPGGGNNKQT